MYLILLTLFSIIHISFLDRNNINKLKKVALSWSIFILLTYILSLLLFSEFLQFQFSNNIKWLENFSINTTWGNIILSIDGISLFFIGLSIILIPICFLISWESIQSFNKEFILFLLIILIILIGVFSTLDILIFYILFESTLIPMFLLIGIWGSREEKIKAAFYFFFYTLIGSLLMLICIFKLYIIVGSTNLQTLINLEIPTYLQFWFFIGFTLSLGVKIPMIPVHIWLPQAHVEAPLSGSILLAGILLKLGGYGFLRFVLPIFPIAFEYFSPIMILMSIIAIIYGGLTTCRQSDMKRLIAYSSVSHMGLVTLSIFTHSNEGIIASIITMLAHGLISSGLFMSSGVLYTRHHSRIIKYFKGLTTTMPLLSSLTLILILSNIGFPLTFNFIAELFSILAAFNYSWIIGLITCSGTLIGTIYAFYFYNRLYFGNLNSYLFNPREINFFELLSFIPLIILTLILGIYPNYIIKFMFISLYLNISL
uniref:NADH dehydrogenase subunit 4 n=1 Tax=Resomia ornicephala TaxID=557396 RepID=UPI0026E44B83|nr:NADH dehydrogenase subunit 4 [Resomia ornicephala]WJJ70074.1 NADH dehydrogenase subunit 4 [Resomia ornicephala]WJJ70086.1 NADH dehydrogenase subunit 4 [Resomia ornicephala]